MPGAWPVSLGLRKQTGEFGGGHGCPQRSAVSSQEMLPLRKPANAVLRRDRFSFRRWNCNNEAAVWALVRKPRGNRPAECVLRAPHCERAREAGMPGSGGRQADLLTVQLLLRRPTKSSLSWGPVVSAGSRCPRLWQEGTGASWPWGQSSWPRTDGRGCPACLGCFFLLCGWQRPRALRCPRVTEALGDCQ